VYEIGTVVWFKGDKVTITSEPFMLHGGEFQNAEREDGRSVVVATPAQKLKDVQIRRAEREAQQAEFRRLPLRRMDMDTTTKAEPKHGVFVWRADNRYVRAESVKDFTSEKLARKHADRLNETNAVHVVRTLAYTR